MAEFKRVINIIPLIRVDLGASQIFTYLVPLDLHGSMRLGQLVRVPFGGRSVLGVVSSAENHRLRNEAGGLKPVKEVLESLPVLSEKALKLAEWISEHYVCSLGLVVKAMLPKYIKRPKQPELVGFERRNPDFVLTEYQRRAVTTIVSALDQPREFLLHGVTGSGKTEVYMQVIQRLMETGRQTLMLVPEISLTPQAVERFARRFGMENIAVMHSRMKNSERYWMWKRIREGEKKVIVGPRSAVFAPVQDLGLIIMDEEHDSSYKQYDQNPKYHARTVARKLSEIWQCPLVLGDATPSVESFHAAQTGDANLLILPHRIKADVGLPPVKIVDMKKELMGGNTSMFSEELKARVLLNLNQNKQVILFMNRRGSATVVMCRDCGYVLKCADCSTALVWHSYISRLLCHHCETKAEMPLKCPECQSHRIKQFGAGTQRVERELEEFLKESWEGKEETKVVRMDRDTTGKRGSGEKIYNDWTAGRINILIGTQMISKGWDIRRVGLVGIVSADTALHLPDFRSGERTFQILTQVAGRAGRGDEPGFVILQTYHPENYAVKAAKQHDYGLFYEKEIAERKKHQFPPFVRLVKLKMAHKDFDKAKEQVHKLFREVLNNRKSAMEVLGPSPAFIPKLRGKYQFQIILKLPKSSQLDLFKFFKDLKIRPDIDVEPESLL